jgi:TonB family protein
MFDKLVVSSLQKRKHTSAKYLLGTAAVYLFTIAGAFAVSVLMSEPKLADTSRVLTLVGPPLPQAPGSPRVIGDHHPQQAPSRPDLYHFQTLDNILKHNTGAPPAVRPLENDGDVDTAVPNAGHGFGSDIGVSVGDPATLEQAPRPDPPKPVTVAQPLVTENRPIRVSSFILQGKAIERKRPDYPQLAQQIHLQGDVSIEVMIAPDGRVESARVMSGHPMFAEKAREAALGWRFQPTILNNVPVRVTGVIVFKFKLNE